MKIQNGNIRAVEPPARITSRAMAMQVFNRYREYKSHEFNAYAKYMRAGGGTATANVNYEKYEKYSEIADRWGDVLEKWLQNVPE